VALKIIGKVPVHAAIEKLEVAGPGFVNINLGNKFVEEQVKKRWNQIQ